MTGQNPAQPFIDMRNKLVSWAKKIDPDGDSTGGKVDRSWHAEMVKRANESFIKTKKKPTMRKRGGAKR